MSAVAIVRSAFHTSLRRYARSRGLWLLLLVAPVAARFWIAGAGATSSVITVNNRAPLMDSAMLGVTLGAVTSTLLLPITYAYLRANVTRRQPWQVEEVSAAPRVAITLGRFGADAVVLAGVLAGTAFAGWVIGWLLVPVPDYNPLLIAGGLWLIAAPALMGVAALRILFDALPATRGVLGDVLFFLFWATTLMVGITVAATGTGLAADLADFAGFVRPLGHERAAGADWNVAIGASSLPLDVGRIDINAAEGLAAEGYILSRLAWAAIAVAIAAFAGLVYRPHRARAVERHRGRFAGWLEPGVAPRADPSAPPAGPSGRPLIGLLLAELRLIPTGRLWLAFAVATAVGGLFLPYRPAISGAALLLLVFGATAQAGRSEASGLLRLTGTTATPASVRRVAFVAAGTLWMLGMSLPAALRAGPDILPLAVVLGAAASLGAILLAAATRSAFTPRLALLFAWYGYISI